MRRKGKCILGFPYIKKMLCQKKKEEKFTYNDVVKINLCAPKSLAPGEEGVICGFSELESKPLALYSDEIYMYFVFFSCILIEHQKKFA